MNKVSNTLLSKFLSGKRLTENEFAVLENLLDDADQKYEIFHWLENEWQESASEAVSLQFEQIRKKIRSESRKKKLNRLIVIFSKVAAVLFIPLFITTLYFYSNQSDSAKLLTLSTQKGEQTSVVLPDGSKVWLNVDTKLSYPVNYGVKSRNVKLEGEAYFEVARNKELPFEVSSGDITTKALGTSFAISSYPESAAIKSSLLEGSVEVKYGEISEILKPGQQLVYNKGKSGINIQSFDETDELAWKNEQLIFRLTPFNQVIEELEKWYNVGFEYKPATFESETFTAKFERHETLEHVLQVMEKAGGLKYRIEGKTVKIMKH